VDPFHIMASGRSGDAFVAFVYPTASQNVALTHETPFREKSN
jgi:hypothetical protein